MDAITPLVKERPIIFSAAMVRAILDGRKTQFRKLVKDVRGNPVPPVLEVYQDVNPNGSVGWFTDWRHDFGHRRGLSCPQGQVGERLWVKETWKSCDCSLDICKGTVWAADFCQPELERDWVASTRMPRRVSRILLEIIDLRAERVQRISEVDAIAEGAEPILVPPDGGGAPHVEGFRTSWVDLHGNAGWNANHWVWVVEFKRVDAA